MSLASAGAFFAFRDVHLHTASVMYFLKDHKNKLIYPLWIYASTELSFQSRRRNNPTFDPTTWTTTTENSYMLY